MTPAPVRKRIFINCFLNTNPLNHASRDASQAGIVTEMSDSRAKIRD